MARDIPEEIVGKVIDRPIYLNYGGGRGEIGLKIARLASALNAIDPTKAISYDSNEFCKIYAVKENDKTAINKRLDYIKTQARIIHKIKAKGALDNGHVIFWKVNV